MNWHEIIEERSYEMHQVVAEVLQQDPKKLQLVIQWIEQALADPEFSDHSKDALKEWLEVIHTRGLPGIIEIINDRGENAVRMRQNSPFAVVMPQEARLKILQRYEARRPRTHPAGV